MITGVRWFAGRDCVGIVQVVPDHEKDTYRQTGEANFNYYIGVGSGIDEKTDMQTIADWGNKFDVAAGNTLFRVL
jgi:hypothetical protein